MGSVSMLCPEDAISQQTFSYIIFISFLPPHTLFSLSLKYRDCIVDISVDVEKTLVTYSLHLFFLCSSVSISYSNIWVTKSLHFSKTISELFQKICNKHEEKSPWFKPEGKFWCCFHGAQGFVMMLKVWSWAQGLVMMLRVWSWYSGFGNDAWEFWSQCSGFGNDAQGLFMMLRT